MIGYQEEFLEDTIGTYDINLSNNGMYLELRSNESGIPYYVVGFGPTSYRGFAYISIFEPKYISDVDSMLSEEYQKQFTATISQHWEKLKSHEYWKNILPNIMPDYSLLKYQKYWGHNTINKDILFGSIIHNDSIYVDELAQFSVSINESSAYPGIVYFLVCTKEGCAYIDAINFYYLTEDRLSSMYEYDFKRIIYANWDKILKINNKVLDCCPSGLFYDNLADRE